jgi:hypothetical protein
VALNGHLNEKVWEHSPDFFRFIALFQVSSELRLVGEFIAAKITGDFLASEASTCKTKEASPETSRDLRAHGSRRGMALLPATN